MACGRDNNQQQQLHKALQQSKQDAHTAITELLEREEKQKALRKQIIRIKADYEELLEDGKQACTCSKVYPAPQQTMSTLLHCIACLQCS